MRRNQLQNYLAIVCARFLPNALWSISTKAEPMHTKVMLGTATQRGWILAFGEHLQTAASSPAGCSAVRHE